MDVLSANASWFREHPKLLLSSFNLVQKLLQYKGVRFRTSKFIHRKRAKHRIVVLSVSLLSIVTCTGPKDRLKVRC